MRRNIAIYLGVGLSLILCGVILIVGIVAGSASSLAAVGGTERDIHLGNVSDGKGWNETYFSKINGEGGAWPGAVVFMSNQVYDIKRAGSSCHIEQVSVESNDKQIAWEYLQSLPPETKIVIRIYPSPGYFTAGHRLVSRPVDDHCSWPSKRSIDDIADEICAIQKFNDENGLGGRWVGFLPANEPNLEWYTRPWPTPQPTIQPQHRLAWMDMDAYFTAIYEYVKGRCPDAQVLTPPMAQNLWAEEYRVSHKECRPMRLTEIPTGTPEASGYYQMPHVFMNGTANDGYTWNNYWAREGEPWFHCKDSDDFNGQHVAVYFPPTMQARIVAKGGLITEADLASPKQNFGNPLKDKDQNYGLDAACSLKAFYDAEELADYAAAWNLNVSIGDEEMN